MAGAGGVFSSDNCSGAHPAVLAALVEANAGRQPSYGADAYTERLRQLVRDRFGDKAQVFPVFNGTGSNVLALQALTARWESVLCAHSAHVQTSEWAAPEHHGLKLVGLPAPTGRLAAADLEPALTGAVARHRARPGVLSISQSTEFGTCYPQAELTALRSEATRIGLRVHLDGARLANAAAHLGVGLGEAAAGADVVSLGLTKNGGVFGECLVVVEPDAVSGTDVLHKAVTQLPSKTRFVSAQALALLEGDLWLRNARQANRMATRLAAGLRTMAEVRVVHEVQANAVFAVLPGAAITRLAARFSFLVWDEPAGLIRLMTAYDTQPEEVDDLVSSLQTILSDTGGQPVDAGSSGDYLR